MSSTWDTRHEKAADFLRRATHPWGPEHDSAHCQLNGAARDAVEHEYLRGYVRGVKERLAGVSVADPATIGIAWGLSGDVEGETAEALAAGYRDGFTGEPLRLPRGGG